MDPDTECTYCPHFAVTVRTETHIVGDREWDTATPVCDFHADPLAA